MGRRQDSIASGSAYSGHTYALITIASFEQTCLKKTLSETQERKKRQMTGSAVSSL